MAPLSWQECWAWPRCDICEGTAVLSRTMTVTGKTRAVDLANHAPMHPGRGIQPVHEPHWLKHTDFSSIYLPNKLTYLIVIFHSRGISLLCDSTLTFWLYRPSGYVVLKARRWSPDHLLTSRACLHTLTCDFVPSLWLWYLWYHQFVCITSCSPFRSLWKCCNTKLSFPVCWHADVDLCFFICFALICWFMYFIFVLDRTW